jgi:hypothetical protein
MPQARSEGASSAVARPQGTHTGAPYQAFELIEVGADLRVRPGQCCPCKNLTRTHRIKKISRHIGIYATISAPR